jgi:hypothetical protein
MYVGLAVAILLILVFLVLGAVVDAIVTEEEDEDRNDEGWQ